MVDKKLNWYVRKIPKLDPTLKPLISDNQWNVVTSISEGKKMMDSS